MAFEKTNSGLAEWIKRLISWSVFLIPITYIAKSTLYPFISFKTLVFYVFVQIVVGLWLYAVLVKKELTFRFNIVTAAVLLFLLAIILSAIFGVDSGLSFWSNFERMNGVLTWLHLGGMFVVASSVLQSSQDWKHLFWVNGVAATFTAFIAFMGRDGLAALSISEKGGSLIGNTSFVGAYLLMSFFLLAYLWIKKYKSRGVLSVMMLMFLVSPIFFGAKIWNGDFGFVDIFKDPILFLGRARASTLALYSGLGVLIVGGVFQNAKNKIIKNVAKAALWLAAAAALSVVVMFFIKGSPVHDFISQEASKSRVGAWEIAVEGWKERPVFGYGIGAFTYVYQDFYNPLFLTKEYGAETWMDQAHSVGYEVLVTTGAFGAATFAFIYIAVIIFLWRNYKDEDFDFWTALVPTVLLVVHLIQNLTVFDTITTYQMFAIVLAFVAAQGGKEIESTHSFWEKGPGHILAFGGMTAAIIFFVIVPYVSSSATINFSKGDFISDQSRIDTMLNRIESSSVGETEKIKLLSEIWREQIVRFPQIVMRFNENVVYTQDRFIEIMEGSLEKHPHDMRTMVTISRMALFQRNMASEDLKQGYMDKARHYANLAIETSPNHQMGLWTLAAVENADGNRQLAYDLAKEAYDWAPTAMNAEAILAQYE